MRRQGGYTYMLVIFIVALVGVGLATAGDIWATARQRGNEVELLFAGNAYRQAIASYYQASPGIVKQYPPKLDDLLKDPRFPDTRRHLRQLYPDPFGKSGWIEIKAPQGGVMGVASSSENAPLKRVGFSVTDRVFEEPTAQLKEKLRYRDWEFVYIPNSR